MTLFTTELLNLLA